jgi:enoyl-CoA hydratase
MNVETRSTSLLHHVAGPVGIAILNRPAVLNVIDMGLIKSLYAQLEAWRVDPAITAVVVRGAGERAFCAGGDVRAVYEQRGDDTFMHEVYRVEYVLNDAIARYSKPYIALMSGIVMGGGCGISVHGSHRVVTETTQIAMPECRIGLFPDIGASWFLARCPGELGLYLGLTGTRIGAADALYLWLADYLVPAERLGEIVPALAQGKTANAVLAELSTFSRSPHERSEMRESPAPDFADAHPGYKRSGAPPLSALRNDLDAVFGLGSVRDIIAALESHPQPWARQAHADMLAACPLSLELTFRAISEGRTKTLRDCLVTDFRIAQRLMRRNDYFEGVRARIIDKDNRPRWTHNSVEEVSAEEVEEFFAPLGAAELRFDAAQAH